jgi:hypothetical protein
VNDVWFTEYADELATCLVDAERCADACERLLVAVREGAAVRSPQRLVRAIVAPTAVALVLLDLIDDPPELVLATARLCAETSSNAVRELERFDLLAVGEARDALRAFSASCGRFAAAAG